MLTNCGLMTPRWYDINCGNLQPDLQSRHIPYFHSLLCEWSYNPALPFFWVVVIDAQNKNHLFGSIQRINEIEPRYKGQWNIKQTDLENVYNDRTQHTIGCIFAQACRIPGETISIEHFGGGEKNNGHLKSPGVTNRNDLSTLEIGFLETNKSITDVLLRPWTIITGYKGLIVDDGSLRSPAPYWGGSIKCDIHIYQLAKAASSSNNPCVKSIIRKDYHFYDAAPIQVTDDDISYTPGGVNLRQVQFAYNYYTVGHLSREIKGNPVDSTITNKAPSNTPQSQQAPLAPQGQGQSTNVLPYNNGSQFQNGSQYNGGSYAPHPSNYPGSYQGIPDGSGGYLSNPNNWTTPGSSSGT